MGRRSGITIRSFSCALECKLQTVECLTLVGTEGAVSRIINPVVPELLEALAAKLTAMGRRMVVWNTDADGAGGVIAAMR